MVVPEVKVVSSFQSMSTWVYYLCLETLQADMIQLCILDLDCLEMNFC